MTISIDEVVADLSSFSDSDDAVAVDSAGVFLLERGNEEIQGRLHREGDGLWVEIDDDLLEYSKFITHRLARLDVLAERILSLRGGSRDFVNGPGTLYTPMDGTADGAALDLLIRSCERQSPFASKVVFLTADAGLGKTELLRQAQRLAAERFLETGTGGLFWHVDLQGRRLLLLNDALAGNLDQLRFAGLWAPGIRRLMRRRDLVVAIDGFDELAAEQGGTEAVGALAHLVRSLESEGTVVAASRRTFFDTEDYQRRSGLMSQQLSSSCDFEELRLHPWGEAEVRQLFDAMSGDATAEEDLYSSLLAVLGGDPGHPMLTRPFLVSHIGKAVYELGLDPDVFGGTVDDPLEGVERVVRAFVDREVASKWVDRDSGHPYLTVEQHLTILGDIAEEMSLQGVDRLPVDIIESLALLRLDEWGVPPGRQQQIFEMLGMHVLLVPPELGGGRDRSFDHPEFRDYFVARSLISAFHLASDDGAPERLLNHLRVSQLSDSTVRYLFSIGDFGTEERGSLLEALAEVVDDEWRPTYLQSNAGSIVAAAANGIEWSPAIHLCGGLVFASLVFDHVRLSGLRIEGASFLHAQLHHTHWENVELVGCDLGDLTVSDSSSFTDVTLEACTINSLTVRPSSPDGEEERFFSPDEMLARLAQLGMRDSSQGDESGEQQERTEGQHERLARRLVMMFYRTSTLPEKGLEMKFKQGLGTIMSEILPVMERHGVVRSETWTGSGRQAVWTVRRSPDDLLRAREGEGDPRLQALWDDIRALDS